MDELGEPGNAPAEEDRVVMEIHEVPLSSLLELRERILTPGHPGRPVVWPYDDASARHYGAFDELGLIGCVSASPAGLSGAPEFGSYRFHSMAVETGLQRRGIGRLLLSRLAQELLADNAQMMWATARPSAVGFYRHCGLSMGEPVTVQETGFQVQYVTADRAIMRALSRGTAHSDRSCAGSVVAEAELSESCAQGQRVRAASRADAGRSTPAVAGRLA